MLSHTQSQKKIRNLGFAIQHKIKIKRKQGKKILEYHNFIKCGKKITGYNSINMREDLL